MDPKEIDLQRQLDNFTRSHVLLCLSSLVATLASGYGAAAIAQRHWGDGAEAYKPALREFCSLAEQAAELTTPVDDYEEAARQEGWTVTLDHNNEYVAVHKGARHDEPDVLTAESLEDAYAQLCDNESIDPYQREVYEHWAISDRLADLLEAEGERVDRDFAGLTVWARTTTGQSMILDGCIRRAYERAQAELAELVK